MQALQAANGVNVDAMDCKGRTALHRQLRGRLLTVMQLAWALVATVAGLGVADQPGCTLIKYARASEG